METINFLFGVHNHQPQGNFHHIFRDGFERCYSPFLGVLESHPTIKLSLHYSGPLLEWIIDNHPSFFDRIKALVVRGQVEIMGGGFYEPIFSMVPSDDFVGQLQLMKDFVRKIFDFEAEGIWLSERVWDPSIPKSVAPCGIKYTILDDTHFRFAGLPPHAMLGYYVTEREGFPLSIFPIDKFLRYSIPFKDPEETVDYLISLATKEGNVAITYADDGEKFGMWPGTHEWVYKQKWLENFFSRLEANSKSIRMLTFNEYLRKFPASGRIYLPTASYEEMTEWALPAETAIQYEDLKETLKEWVEAEKISPFLRGGIWENFLTKYPESNHMQKKMLYVREKALHALSLFPVSPTDNIHPAIRELYRAQCNCAYWHGIFGGLYLGHLRGAVYHHLINVEKLIAHETRKDDNWLEWRVFDLDRDLKDEVVMENSLMNLYIKPDYGGAVIEWDYIPRSYNLMDTLTRRIESYHRKIKGVSQNKKLSSPEQPRTIHELIKQKEGGLEAFLAYDWYRRYSFLDHFLGPETDLEHFQICQYPELGDFILNSYAISAIDEKEGGLLQIRFSRDGKLSQKGRIAPFRVEKTFSLYPKKSIIKVDYVLTNLSDAALPVWFGIEWNLSFKSGDDCRKYYLIPGQKKNKTVLGQVGSHPRLETFRMQNEVDRLFVGFWFNPQAGLWRFPLETVSQSETGFERSYQGSVILAHWKFYLPERGVEKISLTLEAGNL